MGIHDLPSEASHGPPMQKSGSLASDFTFSELGKVEETASSKLRARTLSGHQKKLLASKLENKLQVHDDHSHHGHGHADRSPSLFTACVSGIINYLLMFGLCSAYGLIMFADEHNQRHCALGVKMNLGCSMILGLLVAFFSKIKVAIGGPDLNPVVLLGIFIETMQTGIAEDLGLDLSGARRLASDSGGYGKDELFCYGSHLQAYPLECETFHKQLRATTIFATALSSLVFTVLFVTFGRFRLTRYVSYIPTSIMEAFLSCIGYKVFLYALKFCKYDVFQFVPAACIGVPLYFMKAFHIGHPGVVLPLGLLVPLGLFYVVVYYAMGSDIEQARKDKLMFPYMENIQFYHVWTDSVLAYEHVNFTAWLKTLPDLAIMIIVVVLDCLLKINGTENKLPVKVDKDYEVTLFGLSNILTTLTGSSVGYMQLKFNVINYGVIGNIKDRRAAVVYALLCAGCYFGTIAPINYMPRFFVGSLLFFAGAGFVCENLWGSSKFLAFTEWMEVLIILAVFIFTGQLLFAVITGGFLCGISFILKYARVSTIEGKPMRGADLPIVERRGPLIQRNIRHITDSWLLVVRLKGFIFFASATSLKAHMASVIEEELAQQVPSYRRLRFIVLDCHFLDGMDASASATIKKFVLDAAAQKVRVLWSGLSPTFYADFKRAGVLDTNNVLADLDEAVLFVEDLAKTYLKSMETMWIKLHKSFASNQLMMQQRYAFEPFTQIFLSATGRIGCPWRYCSKLKIVGHETVLWKPGDLDGMVYLVHSGSVGLFTHLPGENADSWSSPVAVYKHGWFLNRETIMRMPAKFYGVALEDGELLCWNQEQWYRMAVERPLMMSEILKAVMKQQARDCDTLELAADIHHEGHVDFDDDVDLWDHMKRGVSWQRQASQSSWMRQISEVSLDGYTGQVRIVGDFFKDLPEWLQTRLQNMETAHVLARLKFYQPVPEGQTVWYPPLPKSLKMDLEIAFLTYARKDVIHASEVDRALMFAGIFNRASQDESNAADLPDLDYEEFMKLGHEAIMAPLCERDIIMIEKLFTKVDEDKSGMIDREELTTLLQKIFSSKIHAEEVDGIATAWKDGGEAELYAGLSLDSFKSAMSMFIRKHEHYWNMLQGFCEIFGKDLIHEGDMLTVEHLMAAQNVEITQAQAEEMLWAADWRLENGEGKSLPWTEFASAVYLCIDRPAGLLPPAPRVPGRKFGTRASTSKSFQPSADEGLVDDDEDLFHEATCDKKKHSDQEAESAFLEGGDGAVSEPDSSDSLPPGSRCIAGLKHAMNHPNASLLGRIVKRTIRLAIIVSVLEMILEPFIVGQIEGHTAFLETLWFDMECGVTGLFTLELLMRVVVAYHTKLNYILNFRSAMLFFSTIPLYVELIMMQFVDTSSVPYRAVNLSRLARLVRMTRLAQDSKLMGPTVVSLVVIWGIYKKHQLDY